LGHKLSFALALALTLVACAHDLKPCAACGPGFLCRELASPGATVPLEQCFRGCKADRDCPTSFHCNCDEDACTIHSGRIPFDVCVAPSQRTNDPDLQMFFPQSDEQRSCSTCGPDEVCLDTSHAESPVYKCFKQCVVTLSCKLPLVCNCAPEKGAICRDDLPQQICIDPAAPPR
jgi:hypothetical protein